MEKVGSNSEDPFEGRVNDVPMTAMCRTTEIDLCDILNKTKTGMLSQVKHKNNI